jgi:hypothetical protein
MIRRPPWEEASSQGRLVPYSEFSIDEVKSRFKLRIAETEEYFANVPPIQVSDFLIRMLAENIPLAVAISTEKARSELIIAPVLLEARRQVQKRVSLFSGVEFTVDQDQGLNGVCDYLLSLSPEQLTIEAPVVAVVEAKNDNLKAGLGQCMAEMVASRLFNQKRERPLTRVYGVVTTGSLWKFLRLEGDVVSLDLREYPISELGRVVGILVSMVRPESSSNPESASVASSRNQNETAS